MYDYKVLSFNNRRPQDLEDILNKYDKEEYYICRVINTDQVDLSLVVLVRPTQVHSDSD